MWNIDIICFLWFPFQTFIHSFIPSLLNLGLVKNLLLFITVVIPVDSLSSLLAYFLRRIIFNKT